MKTRYRSISQSFPTEALVIFSLGTPFVTRTSYSLRQKSEETLHPSKGNCACPKQKFRLRHKKEKVNVVAAMMDRDDTISELEEALQEVEAKKDILDAVAAGYADIRDAASREITRRSSERAAVD